jgi:hypothetical protein
MVSVHFGARPGFLLGRRRRLQRTEDRACGTPPPGACLDRALKLTRHALQLRNAFANFRQMMLGKLVGSFAG